MKDYCCLHCGGKLIYTSVTPVDQIGTLSCYYCGETEDSRYGISYKGKKIENYVVQRQRKKISNIFIKGD